MGHNLKCDLYTTKQSIQKPYSFHTSYILSKRDSNDMLRYERIDKEIHDARKEAMILRIKRATRQEFKPNELRRQKKSIARLLTARREMQIADGISNAEYKWEKTWKTIKLSKTGIDVERRLTSDETLLN